MRLCLTPHCGTLVEHGYCAAHAPAQDRHKHRFHEPQYGAQVSYGRKWRRARNNYLAEHPYCACGCQRLAEVVDHITPHRGDPLLFWDQTNWQALTKACHDRKTAHEVLPHG
jgi:5-methylcytosine-specific restriction protein A